MVVFNSATKPRRNWQSTLRAQAGRFAFHAFSCAARRARFLRSTSSRWRESSSLIPVKNTLDADGARHGAWAEGVVALSSSQSALDRARRVVLFVVANGLQEGLVVAHWIGPSCPAVYLFRPASE